MGKGGDMSEQVRVSVIVPVFNPGRAFDQLVESLDRQTMPSAEFEVLLCDDGSDEPTRERLASVSRTRPNVRVLSLPHSGWPGAPRNEGIAAAAGEYIQFVDQDDRLFEAALQSLCDYADLHGSDVVIGKEVGVGRRLPRQIFRRDVPHAVLGRDPLLEMLTPHKMFRTSFLRSHGIRFPEGRVRLEDHLFVMRAYFEAETISILASEPCYAWVKHPGSASSSRIDPAAYFPHLEAVLDLVEAHTEPGKLRDRLLRHWFRGKILKRLTGRQMVRYPDEHRQHLLDVVTPLTERRFGPGVDRGLAFPHRLRAALLRAGRRADLLRLAEFEASLECRAVATSARWSRGGGLHLGVSVTVTGNGETAFTAEATDSGRIAWVSATALGELPLALLDDTRDARRDRVKVFAGVVGADTERLLFDQRPRRLENFAVAVDPLKAFPRDDSSRTVRIVARVRRGGWSFDVPLTADPVILSAVGRSPLLAGRPIVLATMDDGTVALRRDKASGGVRDAAGRAVRRVRARRKS